MAFDLDQLAALAYTAYAEAVGGRAYNGDPLPAWDALPDAIKAAWAASADAVRLADAGRLESGGQG